MVTNVRILKVDGIEILTTCNFQLYRTRLNSEEDSWIGRREDLLRRVDGELKLARRHIFLEQTVILAQNMSNLF
jgi:biphenyl 2,3-dioxygenase beta subunit